MLRLLDYDFLEAVALLKRFLDEYQAKPKKNNPTPPNGKSENHT